MTPVLPPPKNMTPFFQVRLAGSLRFFRVKRHFAVFQVCRDRAAYFKSTGNKLSEAAEGRMLKDFWHAPPKILTWNQKMMVSTKESANFQGLLFRFHVKFQGCILGCETPFQDAICGNSHVSA